MVAFRGLIAGLILTVWAWLEGARPTGGKAGEVPLSASSFWPAVLELGPTASLLFRQALQVFCQPFFR